MDLINNKNAVKLIMSVLDRTVKPTPIIKYRPAKTRTVSAVPSTRLERTSPESVGVRSDYIAGFIRKVAGDKSTRMHTLIVARHGKIIAETAAAPYDMNEFHTCFSLSKSVTGLAVGMLIDDRLLTTDEQLWRIIDKKLSPLSAVRQKEITVEDCLTMRTGIAFSEAGSVTDEHWRHGYFDSAVNNKGEFAYNSMNSYMLAAVVNAITGKTVSEFLRPRLFEPLGISDFLWECCPDGIEKGGFGLYLRPEDMLKLGMVYLNDGIYDGNRIVSAEWIRRASTAQAKTPQSVSSAYDYGYHVWVGCNHRCILLNGMFGQNVAAFPDTGIVVGFCAGNSEMFHENMFFTYLREYFGAGTQSNFADAPIDENPLAYNCLLRENALRSVVGGITSVLRSPKAAPRKASAEQLLRVLDGVRLPLTYGRVFTKDESANGEDNMRIYGPSLLPLTLEMVQNNYCNPISRLDFSCDGSEFFISFTEQDDNGSPDGAVYRLPVAFSGRAKKTEFDFNGEKYVLSATGVFSSDENNMPVLTVNVAFIETASVRTVRLYFSEQLYCLKQFHSFKQLHPTADDSKGRVQVKAVFGETPGSEMIVDNLGQILRTNPLRGLVGTMVQRVDFSYGDLLEYKIVNTMAPTGTGYLENL